MTGLNLKTLEALFISYYSPLCNYALRIVEDDALAEDIVQEIFIDIWNKNKISTLKNPERFFLRATKYKCIDYLRRASRSTRVDLFDSISIDDSATSDLNEEDLEPLLYYFASKLPPKTKEVFLLSRTSGLTYKEIAEEMNISIKTVENQMGRALKLMRQYLKEHDLLCLVLLLRLL